MHKVPEMEWMFHDVPSPEDEMLTVEEGVELNQALLDGLFNLSATEQRIVEALYLGEEYVTQKELAEELGVDQATVSRWLDQALEKIKAHVVSVG